jgi:hypothetical protein
MNQRFEVATFFDCTATGVQNHKRSKNLSDQEWYFQRNQQRNFETILQCISLRCQPLNINGPYVLSNNESQLYWTFTFESDKQDIFLLHNDPVGLLKQDCHQVPMIVGLSESERELFFTPYLITQGSTPNTFFQQL